MKNRLAGWKMNTLSKAGRLTLIKSNLSSIPNHAMTCFKFPKKITNTMDKYARDFFWGSNSRLCPVSWEQVCKPKQVGGLGVRPAAFFNNAALAKLAWKALRDR